MLLPVEGNLSVSITPIITSTIRHVSFLSFIVIGETTQTHTEMCKYL